MDNLLGRVGGEEDPLNCQLIGICFTHLIPQKYFKRGLNFKKLLYIGTPSLHQSQCEVLNAHQACRAEFSGLNLSAKVTFLSFIFISAFAPFDSNSNIYVLSFHPFTIS